MKNIKDDEFLEKLKAKSKSLIGPKATNCSANDRKFALNSAKIFNISEFLKNTSKEGKKS